MIYQSRPRQLSYGRPIGILVLEESIPCPPGTPGNPTSFAYPVCYEIVRGVTVADLTMEAASASLPAFIAAAQALIARGACAIAGNCGLMIVHQAALASAVTVPVALSALVQLPWIAAMFAPGTPIGVIAARKARLTAAHLRLAGAGLTTIVAGMDDQPHFTAAVCEERGVLDFPSVQAEAVAVAHGLVASCPGMAAILLECVDLPPYAAAIQQEVGLPVFDITSVMAHMAGAIARVPFAGIY